MADEEDLSSNLRRWLEEAERVFGEPIETMVVGPHDTRRYRDPKDDENILLSRGEGLRKVDEDYDNGFGGADCYPLYAWTKSRVFFVHEHDGATDLAWVPRNPIGLRPEFGGRAWDE